MRKLGVLIVALALTACSLPKMDPAAEALAKKAYDQLVAGEDAALVAEFEPAFRGTATPQQFAQIRGLIPPGQPQPPKMTGFNSYAGTGGSTLTLTYVYAYPQSTVTTQTMMAKGKEGAWAIRGLNVNVSGASELAPAPAQPTRPAGPRPKPAPVA